MMRIRANIANSAALAAITMGCGTVLWGVDVAREPAVELPPFVVSEGKSLRAWRYASIQGHEVLSRSSNGLTIDFLQRVRRLDDLLGLIVPPQFRLKSVVPDAAILTAPQNVSASARELVTGAGNRNSSTGEHRSGDVRFLPNLLLDDIDASILFAIVDERRVDPAKLTYTKARIASMIERCTPAPPAWFAIGFGRLLDDLEFGDREVLVRQFTWISREATAQLQDEASIRDLFAILDLFAVDPVALRASDSTAYERYAAQSALLIRWALDGGSVRREGFWRVLSAASVGPVTDRTLEDCLGIDLADLRDQLSDYIGSAVGKSIRLQLDPLPPDAKIVVREASPAEVGRILGDWERLESAYVAARHPEFSGVYGRAAEETLRRALDRAPNDPGVAAVLGLLECDRKNEDGARPFLEIAWRARYPRPRVYLELASLRYHAALRNNAPSGRFSPDQAAEIIAPLAYGEQLTPRFVGQYALEAEVWNRCGGKIAAGNLLQLEAAAAIFPDDHRLLFHLAVLEGRNGNVTKAQLYAQRGKQIAGTDSLRARFTTLLANLGHAQSVEAEGLP